MAAAEEVEGRRASQRRFLRFRRIKIVEKFHAYRRAAVLVPVRPSVPRPPSLSHFHSGGRPHSRYPKLPPKVDRPLGPVTKNRLNEYVTLCTE